MIDRILSCFSTTRFACAILLVLSYEPYKFFILFRDASAGFTLISVRCDLSGTNGDSHLAAKAKEYDEQRTGVMNGYDLEVIRYTNEEVLNHIEKVESDLRKKYRQE